MASPIQVDEERAHMKIYFAGVRCWPPDVSIRNRLLSYHYLDSEFEEIIQDRRKNAGKKRGGKKKAD